MTITDDRVVKLRRWVFAIACVGLLSGSGSVRAEVPEGDLSPDVVVFELPSTFNWGDDGALTAYSVGTTSCNRGDAPLDWISSTNEHPVIAQNLYRVTLPEGGPEPEHGSIEMLGMSWLKHGFVSINSATPGCGDCPGNPPGSQLGVGCTDPYSAGLNGSQSRLGPRSEVNAYTGYFEADYPTPSGSSTLAGRLQVRTSEIVEDPTTYRYFVEGHYISPDDAAAGNGGNNASFREVLVDGTDLDTTGPTEEGRPGIYAWRDLDPEVTIREVAVPGEGIFIVGFKVGDNGDGTWRYEYAVFNLNSHLSGGSFAVPIYQDSQITDIGFRDVDYHSGEPYDGTDWTPEVDLAGGVMRWFTEDSAINPDANALRWSTMYNFRFDADSPPQETVGQIGLFRDGGPASLPVILLAPAADTTTIFVDGFDLGDTSGWDVVVP
ncbi:MAG: hypothetical protein V2I67_05495 [Thermoanaerobaculales bacterium]|jgi:hypothetical protein|nr:hypothetical protein [Thermoanaerobaculales bacterium]